MHLDDPVHNGNVPAVDVEDYHLPCAEGLLSHVQEQYIPPVEGWLHATTEHHHYLQGGAIILTSAATPAGRPADTGLAAWGMSMPPDRVNCDKTHAAEKHRYCSHTYRTLAAREKDQAFPYHESCRDNEACTLGGLSVNTACVYTAFVASPSAKPSNAIKSCVYDMFEAQMWRLTKIDALRQELPGVHVASSKTFCCPLYGSFQRFHKCKAVQRLLVRKLRLTHSRSQASAIQKV